MEGVRPGARTGEIDNPVMLKAADLGRHELPLVGVPRFRPFSGR
jgi:hypothetical protein